MTCYDKVVLPMTQVRNSQESVVSWYRVRHCGFTRTVDAGPMMNASV